MVKREERKERVPVGGTRDILTVINKDPNYVYRWVMDLPGRVEKFKLGGYDVVTDDLEVGQKTVDRESKVGSSVTKLSGTNVLILMRIPKEWYDEDQGAKQDKVNALEESMQADLRRGIIPGTGQPGYGGTLTQHTEVKRK